MLGSRWNAWAPSNVVCVSYIRLRMPVLDIKHMVKWNQSKITTVHPFTYGWRLGTEHAGSLFRETHRKLVSLLQCSLHYKALVRLSRQCTDRRDFFHYSARLILKPGNFFVCSLQEIFFLCLFFSSSSSSSSFYSSFPPHSAPPLLLILLLLFLLLILLLFVILLLILLFISFSPFPPPLPSPPPHSTHLLSPPYNNITYCFMTHN